MQPILDTHLVRHRNDPQEELKVMIQTDSSQAWIFEAKIFKRRCDVKDRSRVDITGRSGRFAVSVPCG